MATTQCDWRFCGKCRGMFWNGDGNNGVCPAGAGHNPVGWIFVLPGDRPAEQNEQTEWRFCNRCHGLFWNGDGVNGSCPTGGQHGPAGTVFTPSLVTVDGSAQIVFHDSTPVGGSAALTLREDGTWTFRSHLHDSGAPSYNVSLACVVVVTSTGGGTAFTTGQQGHLAGTFEPGSRDLDQTTTGYSAQLAQQFDALRAGYQVSLHTHVDFDIGATVAEAVTIAKQVWPIVAAIAL